MNDASYMKLALDLAKNTLGQTSPNPVVGAVVVNNGEIVGMGAHLKAGTEHAEVHAIRMAGDRAKGATIYVTLEPCSHHGKTPPCADLLIEKQVKRVVIASVDPNPVVAGRGIKKLQDACIEVTPGVLKEEADELNKMFFHYIVKKTPYVTLKTATSLDGKIATSTGESKWITGPEAREDVHRLRHQHDAILVGIGTVLADNPSLTTRVKSGGKNPIRIILDHQLRTPLDAKIVTDKEAPTWIVVSSLVTEEKIRLYVEQGVKIIKYTHEKIEINTLLTLLLENGICSVFVEGGSMVNDAFLRSKMINEVITYIAPKIIGGSNAPSSFAGEGIHELNQALQLKIKSVETVGEDIKIVSMKKEG